MALAKDRGSTLSETIAALLRQAMSGARSSSVRRDRRTGLGVVKLGHPVTVEEVRSVDDEP